MQSGAYSSRFKALQKEHMQSLKRNYQEEKGDLIARSHRLHLETSRRCKALAMKRKLMAQKEEKRRQSILARRRQDIEVATEKFQRLNRNYLPMNDNKENFAKTNYTLDDALRVVLGENSAGLQPPAKPSRCFSAHVVDVASGRVPDGNGNIVGRPVSRPMSVPSSLHSDSLQSMVSSRTQFERQLAKHQQDLFEKQQLALKEFNQAVIGNRVQLSRDKWPSGRDSQLQDSLEIGAPEPSSTNQNGVNRVAIGAPEPSFTNQNGVNRVAIGAPEPSLTNQNGVSRVAIGAPEPSSNNQNGVSRAAIGVPDVSSAIKNGVYRAVIGAPETSSTNQRGANRIMIPNDGRLGTTETEQYNGANVEGDVNGNQKSFNGSFAFNSGYVDAGMFNSSYVANSGSTIENQMHQARNTFVIKHNNGAECRSEDAIRGVSQSKPTIDLSVVANQTYSVPQLANDGANKSANNCSSAFFLHRSINTPSPNIAIVQPNVVHKNDNSDTSMNAEKNRAADSNLVEKPDSNNSGKYSVQSIKNESVTVMHVQNGEVANERPMNAPFFTSNAKAQAHLLGQPLFMNTDNAKGQFENGEIEKYNAPTVTNEKSVVLGPFNSNGNAVADQYGTRMPKNVGPGAAKSTLQDVKNKTAVADNNSNRLVNEVPGSRLVKEDSGSRLVKEEPGSRLVKEEPGSRVVKEDPGSRLVKEEPGSRLPYNQPGSRLINNAHQGTRENSGNELLQLVNQPNAFRNEAIPANQNSRIPESSIVTDDIYIDDSSSISSNSSYDDRRRPKSAVQIKVPKGILKKRPASCNDGGHANRSHGLGLARSSSTGAASLRDSLDLSRHQTRITGNGSENNFDEKPNKKSVRFAEILCEHEPDHDIVANDKLLFYPAPPREDKPRVTSIPRPVRPVSAKLSTTEPLVDPSVKVPRAASAGAFRRGPFIRMNGQESEKVNPPPPQINNPVLVDFGTGKRDASVTISREMSDGTSISIQRKLADGLDRTPTDDEINWLWEKVRSCLSREPSNDSNAALSVRQTASVSKTNIDGSALGSASHNSRASSAYTNNFMGNAYPRRRITMDTLNIHARKESDNLLQQRRQMQPTVAVKNGNVANADVSGSMTAFLAAEELTRHPSVNDSVVERAMRAAEQRQQSVNIQNGQPKSRTILSIEEDRLMKSIELLNEKLKLHQNGENVMFVPKPPNHNGFKGYQQQMGNARRMVSYTGTVPRHYFQKNESGFPSNNFKAS